MILLSHPTGNEFVRAALDGFDRAGMLGEFWTTISWNSNAPINHFLPRPLRELFGRRSFSQVVRSRTRTVPLREVVRLVAGTAGVSWRHEPGAFSIDAVSRELDERVANRLRTIESCTAVYAYEDGALQSFRAARDLGLKRIYDLPIGYWRLGQHIFEEEKEREPSWAPTLTGTLDSADKLGRKDDELRLATPVLVASTSTNHSLAGAPCTAKIDIVAYRAPPPISH